MAAVMLACLHGTAGVAAAVCTVCTPEPQEVRMKRTKKTRVLAAAGLGGVALTALLVLSVEASAQGFVTGSGNTDGYSIAGTLHVPARGKPKGDFTVIVHRDSVDGTTVAATCQYKHFADVVISGNTATFRSVGSCVALTSSGGRVSFTSDNTFGIVDNGEPGAGNDTIDVNLASGSGITIPGSVLVDGNFIVTP